MSNPIPNLPPLSSVPDPGTRAYLQAMQDGWNVRNGNSGTGDEKFLTVNDLATASNNSGNAGSAGSTGGVPTSSTRGTQTVNTIRAALQALSDSVFNSKIWMLVTSRIDAIDAPNGLIATANAELKAQIDQVGDGITRLDTVTGNTASSLFLAKKTLGTAEAAIVQLNTVTTGSGSASARALAGLSATITNSSTGLASKASSTDVSTAVAGLDTSVTSRFTTTNAAVGTNASNIAGEATARASQDSAVISAINTMWGAVGGSTALVHDGSTITVTNNGSVASAYTQLQTTAGNAASAASSAQGTANSASSAASTAQARADSSFSLATTANGKTDGAWAVKFDVYGHVAGIGLGISSSLGGATSSNFVVNADAFTVASGGSTLSPFVVKTTAFTDAAGTYHPYGGVIINDVMAASATIGDASITTAKIADAQITTAKIADAQITTAKIADAQITTAKIGSAQITTAKIGDAQVNTLQLAGQSVTFPAGAMSIGTYAVCYITCEAGVPVLVAASGGALTADYGFPLTIYRDGSPLVQVYNSMSGGPISFTYYDVPGAGTHSYAVNSWGSSMWPSSIFAIACKR